ncbi:hypothetical protein QWZ08_14110 [Ferruginibacter paludis]|uniref:hypothetical protein n=1 Tax=Ferruginibacter paludis TaxID=1310417 RepID=UPI0025B29DA7|nr:hypothetical protein [Ferruginibacter paludis]MDN3656776.1 hypothetical protein [Ferruginibacter paludis]
MFSAKKNWTVVNITGFDTRVMKKNMAFTLFLLWTFNLSVAQQGGHVGIPQWSFSVGAGAGKSVVQDRRFTALSFDGTTVAGFAAAGYVKNKASHQLECSFTKGNLQTADKQNTLRNSHFTADYTNLYQLGNSERPFIYKAGICVNVLYNGRSFGGFINNNTSFDFATSLGAAATVLYVIGDPSAGFSIKERISIPVVSAIVQPSFGSNSASASSEKAGFSPGDIFSQSRIQSFNSFLRLINMLGVEKMLADRHQLALNYTWDYCHFSGGRKVLQANHTIVLSYSFIL